MSGRSKPLFNANACEPRNRIIQISQFDNLTNYNVIPYTITHPLTREDNLEGIQIYYGPGDLAFYKVNIEFESILISTGGHCDTSHGP